MPKGRVSILIAVLALAALAAAGALAARDGDVAAPAPESASTVDGTWVDADGNGTLERGPGEPLIARTDLAPASPATRTLATLVQITDTHVRDEESPARASLLDRLSTELNSTFRPQEALSPQVFAAVVAATDQVSPDAVVLTGDLIDSSQRNELDQFLAVADGGTVDPDSGSPGYVGPQEGTNPDPFFYRPDVDAPRHPGLLEDAQRSFRSAGFAAPWYPLVGNHDLLAQGEVPPTPALERLATGDRLLTGLRRNLPIPRSARSAAAGSGPDLPEESALSPGLVNRVIGNGLPGPTRRVPADPSRSYLTPAQTLARLRAASGHGGNGPLMDYSFDVGAGTGGAGVRVISIDLTDRAGGSGGVVAPGQPRWLRRRLARAGDRPVIVMSHQPIDSSRGGGQLLSILARDPNVIATLHGDTHSNSITAVTTSAGGYWRIGTSSLADYPQQARVIRIVQTSGGGVALETWMIDGIGSPLADTARELSYLDAGGGRPQGDAGEPGDRNARLYRSRLRPDPPLRVRSGRFARGFGGRTARREAIRGRSCASRPVRSNLATLRRQDRDQRSGGDPPLRVRSGRAAGGFGEEDRERGAVGAADKRRCGRARLLPASWRVPLERRRRGGRPARERGRSPQRPR